MIITEEAQDSLELVQRRKLVERIVATTSFQRSARLRDLLLYLTDRTLTGHGKDLTENQIGRAVFGKSADFSPVEDSSVRVHVRQLRLKLHEYFDGEGRHEPLIIEIPKGAYITVFRPVHSSSATSTETFPPSLSPALAIFPESISTLNRQGLRRALLLLPWILVVLLIGGCMFLLHSNVTSHDPDSAQIPWPLSSVFDGSHRTYIVLADSNYGMLRIMGHRAGSLEDYLQSQYPRQFLPPNASGTVSLLANYLSDSVLTSYADVVAATMLMNQTHRFNSQTLIRSARNLQMRDLAQGNFVFLGSPSSNPWVSLFVEKLNFQEKDTNVGQAGKCFQNLHPLPGEQLSYQGLRTTGEAGEDYASIALLPSNQGSGRVLILQGLQQEGTEAASEFLGNFDNLRTIRKLLGVPESDTSPLYFEALIRTKTLAGTPNSTEIVTVRRIR